MVSWFPMANNPSSFVSSWLLNWVDNQRDGCLIISLVVRIGRWCCCLMIKLSNWYIYSTHKMSLALLQSPRQEILLVTHSFDHFYFTHIGHQSTQIHMWILFAEQGRGPIQLTGHWRRNKFSDTFHTRTNENEIIHWSFCFILKFHTEIFHSQINL